MTISTQQAVVVYESMFGNTEKVARAVASGLEIEGVEATVVEVADAPKDLPPVDLLVVGAPTHAFSLSRPSTRADAVQQGAPASHATIGLREWLGAVNIRPNALHPVVAVFDTRVTKVRHLPKAAASRAARLVRRDGLTLATRPASFLVDDLHGPLAEGELERAVAWGRFLGSDSRVRAAARQARSSVQR